MAIEISELAVGAVAYFDVLTINSNPAIDKPPGPTPRNGPFLCVQVIGEISTWTALTWTARPERLYIEPEWRERGTAAWHRGTPYISDGANTYIGPNAEFSAASTTADTYRPETRQWVNADGIAAALKYIQDRGGALQ